MDDILRKEGLLKVVLLEVNNVKLPQYIKDGSAEMPQPKISDSILKLKFDTNDAKCMKLYNNAKIVSRAKYIHDMDQYGNISVNVCDFLKNVNLANFVSTYCMDDLEKEFNLLVKKYKDMGYKVYSAKVKPVCYVVYVHGNMNKCKLIYDWNAILEEIKKSIAYEYHTHLGAVDNIHKLMYYENILFDSDNILNVDVLLTNNWLYPSSNKYPYRIVIISNNEKVVNQMTITSSNAIVITDANCLFMDCEEENIVVNVRDIDITYRKLTDLQYYCSDQLPISGDGVCIMLVLHKDHMDDMEVHARFYDYSQSLYSDHLATHKTHTSAVYFREPRFLIGNEEKAIVSYIPSESFTDDIEYYNTHREKAKITIKDDDCLSINKYYYFPYSDPEKLNGRSMKYIVKQIRKLYTPIKVIDIYAPGPSRCVDGYIKVFNGLSELYMTISEYIENYAIIQKTKKQINIETHIDMLEIDQLLINTLKRYFDKKYNYIFYMIACLLIDEFCKFSPNFENIAQYAPKLKKNILGYMSILHSYRHIPELQTENIIEYYTKKVPDYIQSVSIFLLTKCILGYLELTYPEDYCIDNLIPYMYKPDKRIHPREEGALLRLLHITNKERRLFADLEDINFESKLAKNIIGETTNMIIDRMKEHVPKVNDANIPEFINIQSLQKRLMYDINIHIPSTITPQYIQELPYTSREILANKNNERQIYNNHNQNSIKLFLKNNHFTNESVMDGFKQYCEEYCIDGDLTKKNELDELDGYLKNVQDSIINPK